MTTTMPKTFEVILDEAMSRYMETGTYCMIYETETGEVKQGRASATQWGMDMSIKNKWKRIGVAADETRRRMISSFQEISKTARRCVLIYSRGVEFNGTEYVAFGKVRMMEKK